MSIVFDEHQTAAAQLCVYFQSKGFETYWVGGAVRDLMNNKTAKHVRTPDIDFATAATPLQTKRILKQLGMRFYDVGEKYGTVGAALDSGNMEITTFRSEGSYLDSRHPGKVKFETSPQADALRRDFTINALYYDPLTSSVLDFTGGAVDLKNKRLRFVGSPKRRIIEDPLRLLRAIRFAAKLNFEIVDLREIKAHANLIKKVSPERIKEELDKIFSDANYLYALQLLDKTNLLKNIFPEVDNLKSVKQSKDVHAEGNAFVHTFLAMRFAKDFDRDLRYAVFFHDIGKAKTSAQKMVDGRKRISFHGHAQVGAVMFKKIAKRLRFSRQQQSKIEFLIKHHMDLLNPNEFKQKTLIKWAKKPYFKELVQLRIADTNASIATDKKGLPIKRNLIPLKKLFKIREKVLEVQDRKLISGNDVMRVLKIKSGPEVGKILELVEEEQLRGKIKTKFEALKFVKTLDKHLK